MIPVNTKQRDHEIEAAWAQQKLVLHDACFDALSGLLTILLGLFSFIHAAVRVVSGLVGLLIWTIALWIIFLQWARAYCIKQSSISPFKQEVQADE